MIFSELLSSARDLLDSGEPLLLTVTQDSRGDGQEQRLTAQAIEPLEQAAAKASDGLRVFLRESGALQSLKAVLAQKSGGAARGRVTLVLDLESGREVELELPDQYKLSTEMRRAVKAIPGVVVQDH